MKVDTYRCDVCGIQKGETNHWFRIATGDQRFEMVVWNNLAKAFSEKHLCSDGCVIKTVQAWLSAQKEAA